jgi:NAD-dependent dihydropyrimidine dehydrogenase PreA subunit
MNKFIYHPEVLTLELDETRCSNCGICVKVCPHEVFSLIDKKVYVVARDYCMECGACKRNCPQEAISVNVGDGCGCATGIIQGAIN